MPRPLLCPICKSPAQGSFDRTGDATGFHCATHSVFKVADTVFAEQRTKNYTSEQWEAALRKAKQGTKPGEWPLITTNDF
jgi:sarcosine oxidase delta subunit